jgi:hypothetical protein
LATCRGGGGDGGGGSGFRIPGIPDNLQGMLNLVSGGQLAQLSQLTSIGGLINKGSYHLKNRMLSGGLSGLGDVFNPAKTAFNVCFLFSFIFFKDLD